MTVDQALVDSAVALCEARLPGQVWAGAAALRLADGTLLTSTAPRAVNPTVETCHETGALCEAWKLDRSVVASVCVTRADDGCFWVLAPCGVCQERLFAHGPAVQVGVPDRAEPTRWRSLRLDEVAPHWWGAVFPDE